MNKVFYDLINSILDNIKCLLYNIAIQNRTANSNTACCKSYTKRK